MCALIVLIAIFERMNEYSLMRKKGWSRIVGVLIWKWSSQPFHHTAFFSFFCSSKTVSVLHNNYTWTVPNEKKIRRFNDDVVSLYTMTEHYVSKPKVCKECVVSIQSMRNVKASESTFVIALRQRMSYNRYTDAHK